MGLYEEMAANLNENTGGLSGGLMAVGDMFSTMAARLGAAHGKPGGHWAASFGEAMGYGNMALKQGFAEGRDRRDQQMFLNWAKSEADKTPDGTRKRELLEAISLGPRAQPYVSVLPSLWNADNMDRRYAAASAKAGAFKYPTRDQMSSNYETIAKYNAIIPDYLNWEMGMDKNKEVMAAYLSEAQDPLKGIYDPAYNRRTQFLQNNAMGLFTDIPAEERNFQNFLPAPGEGPQGDYMMYTNEGAEKRRAELARQGIQVPEPISVEQYMQAQYMYQDRPGGPMMPASPGGIPMSANGMYGYNPATGGNIPVDNDETPGDEIETGAEPGEDPGTLAEVKEIVRKKAGGAFDTIANAFGYGSGPAPPRGSAVGEPTAEERFMAAAAGEDPDALPAFVERPEQLPWNPNTDIAELFSTRSMPNPEIPRQQRAEEIAKLPLSDRVAGAVATTGQVVGGGLMAKGRQVADVASSVNDRLNQFEDDALGLMNDQSIMGFVKDEAIPYMKNDFPGDVAYGFGVHPESLNSPYMQRAASGSQAAGPRSLPGLFGEVVTGLFDPILGGTSAATEAAMEYGGMGLGGLAKTASTAASDVKDVASDIKYAAGSDQAPMDALLLRKRLQERKNEIMARPPMRRSLIENEDSQLLYDVLQRN